MSASVAAVNCCGVPRDWSGGVHVSRPLARYVVANELAEGVPSLAPKVLPDRYRDNPHKYVERLNFGRLPYIERSAPPASLLLAGLWLLHQRPACLMSFSGSSPPFAQRYTTL